MWFETKKQALSPITHSHRNRVHRIKVHIQIEDKTSIKVAILHDILCIVPKKEIHKVLGYSKKVPGNQHIYIQMNHILPQKGKIS